jgi:hypothetical protein
MCHGCPLPLFGSAARDARGKKSGASGPLAQCAWKLNPY